MHAAQWLTLIEKDPQALPFGCLTTLEEFERAVTCLRGDPKQRTRKWSPEQIATVFFCEMWIQGGDPSSERSVEWAVKIHGFPAITPEECDIYKFDCLFAFIDSSPFDTAANAIDRARGTNPNAGQILQELRVKPRKQRYTRFLNDCETTRKKVET
jgi:hypothetical protein